MDQINFFSSFALWFFPVLLLLIIWDGIWKGIALWKAARNNHLVWFICIIIFNTVGILPIIYILMNKNQSQNIKQ